MSDGRVLGVDACRAGWIGVVLSDDDPSFHFAPEISLLDDLGPAGERAGIDDVLDAAAAAWTARRLANGQAWPMPDPPETFSDGLACAIWT
jgi:predicted RNase H-like nuclease